MRFTTRALCLTALVYGWMAMSAAQISAVSVGLDDQPRVVSSTEVAAEEAPRPEPATELPAALVQSEESPADWIFSSEAMLLERVTGDKLPISPDPAQSLVIFTPPYFEDVDFRVAPGWRVGATRHFEPWDLQLAYFQVDNSFAHFSLPGRYAVPTQIRPSGEWIGWPMENPGFDYASQLSSTELNLKRSCTPRLRLLAGFRYARLEEHYNAYSQPSPPQVPYVPTTPFLSSQSQVVQNNLFGGQLGVESVLWQRGRLTLCGIGKMGLFADHLDRDFERPARDSQLACLGELELRGTYRVAEHLSVCVGYQALWLDGVGLATNPIVAPAYIVVPLPPELDVWHGKNTVFFHGATVGAELRW